MTVKCVNFIPNIVKTCRTVYDKEKLLCSSHGHLSTPYEHPSVGFSNVRYTIFIGHYAVCDPLYHRRDKCLS